MGTAVSHAAPAGSSSSLTWCSPVRSTSSPARSRTIPTWPPWRRFAFFFVPVWWLWVQFSFYADRHESDDACAPLRVPRRHRPGRRPGGQRVTGGSRATRPASSSPSPPCAGCSCCCTPAPASTCPRPRRLYGRYLICFGARRSAVAVLAGRSSGPPRYAVWAAALAADAAGGLGMLSPRPARPAQPLAPRRTLPAVRPDRARRVGGPPDQRGDLAAVERPAGRGAGRRGGDPGHAVVGLDQVRGPPGPGQPAGDRLVRRGEPAHRGRHRRRQRRACTWPSWPPTEHPPSASGRAPPCTAESASACWPAPPSRPAR